MRALDARRGCVLWKTDLEASARSGLALGGAEGGDPKLFVGDDSRCVHAMDPVTGEDLWSQEVSGRPFTGVSGAPHPYQGTLYVPVSSHDLVEASDPEHEWLTVPWIGSSIAWGP